MQEKLRTLHKENYEVPKGEENVVHYKIENIATEPKTGKRISQQILCKTPVRMFDMVMENLKIQGNMVEILYHPLGKYTNELIPIPEDLRIALIEQEKDKEIAELKARLAEAEARQSGEEKKPKKKEK